MADIFEEVEEGIRKDVWTERWRKYGIFAYIGAALLVGGTAVNEYVGYSRAETARINGEKLDASLAALDRRDFEAATEGLEALAATDAAIAGSASQFLAQVRYEANGDVRAAAGLLADAAGTADTALERLALIKSAYLQADMLSRQELSELVAPLRTDTTSAFNALAVELLAAKALAEGDYAYAREEFGYLRVAANVPQGALNRANSALTALPGLELAARAAEAAESAETAEAAETAESADADDTPLAEEMPQ